VNVAEACTTKSRERIILNLSLKTRKIKSRHQNSSFNEVIIKVRVKKAPFSGIEK